MDRSGSVASHAGVPVSEERSLTLPAVFCAIDLAASHMAMLPCPVIQRVDAKTTEKRPEHPVHALINRDANPEQGSFTQRRSWHLHTVLWGNGRLEIERTGDGTPRYLWPLLPDRTVTTRTNRTNELIYRVTRANGQQQIIAADNVLHVAGLSYEGIDGYGLILEHPEARIARFAEEHGFLDLTKSNTRPAVGDVVRIVPNHVCVVVNMADEVVMVRGDEIVGILPVAARGKLR